MEAVKHFGRCYELTLDDRTFKTKEGEPAMDIKFDVAYARGATAREGTVSILGLGYDTIADFLDLSAMVRGEALSQQIKVCLKAGYFSDENLVTIINGYAYYATVTSPPEMWLNIKVSEYNVMGEIQTDLENINNEPIQDAVRRILDVFEDVEEVDFDIEDKTEDHIVAENKIRVTLEFHGKQTLSSAIRKINEQLSDKVYFILNTPAELDLRILEVVDKAADKAAESETLVDSDHGLLSVTGIDAIQGTITTFLDGSIPDEINHLVLKSRLNEQANGTYYITRKQYVGHYMGNEWYVKYTCTGKEKDK